MRFLWLLLIVPLCGCGMEGIHAARPVTRAKFDPVRRTFVLEDSKDNDITVEGLEVEGRGKVDKITIRNNASEVRRANAEQMAGMAAQATANWQGAERTVGALTNLVKEIMPHVPPIVAARALGNLRAATSVSTPWGGGSVGGVPPGVVDGLMVIAGTQATPTSQPAIGMSEAQFTAKVRAAQSQAEIDELVKEFRGQQ